jgi:tetrahydromethanopterin S-methyltransferase subunit F
VDLLGTERRRLGTGMVVFGVVGVLLAGIIGVGLVAGAVAMRNLDDRLTTQQASLADSLDRAGASLGQLASTAGNASTTLATSGVAVAHAGQVLDELANVSSDLQQTLDIAILGQRPLASAASKFGDLATQARVFSGDAAALAAALATNAADVTAVATQIQSLQDRATALSDQVRNFEGTGTLVRLLTAGVLLAGLMVVWFAVLALGVAWAGRRLRRPASAATT